MPATMYIIGWKSQGLRCPDHEVNFLKADNTPYNISLIQMPNGTGKTTTLQLLRAALSGSMEVGNWDPNTVKEFQKKSAPGESGLFELSLLLNDKRATIKMIFNFNSGKVIYLTTYGAGQQVEFKPPADFRKFMSENFVNFYIFDGELAQHLLDETRTDAQSVIEGLFQINIFHTLKEKVGDYWLNQAGRNAATEKRGYNRRKNRLQKLAVRLGKLISEQNSLNTELKKVESYLEQRKKNYELEIQKETTKSEKLEQAKSLVENTRNEVADIARSTLEKMTTPHALSKQVAQSNNNLKLGLDRVKLPESAAREFFEELAEEDVCICGRPIDAPIRIEIKNRAKHYLGSNDVSLLNSIKTAISESIGISISNAEEELKEQLAKLADTVEKEQEAKNEYEQIRLEIEQTDPTIKQVREEIDQLRKQRDDLILQLEEYENNADLGDEQTTDISILTKKLEDASNKLAEITQTLTLKKKRDVLQGMLEKSYEKTKKNISKEICEETNRRINELMPHNDISIDRIDNRLVLKGQSGGSIGEQLSIAYAFLSTLFNRSEHQLPFVVDSPAGPIDLATRPQIGQLIPKLSNQFIAFTISSEREHFVDELERANSTAVQFITLFRKGTINIDEEYRNNNKFSETKDGFCIEDKDFFYKFQADSEQNNVISN